MEPQEPPQPLGYIGQTLSTLWQVLRALLKGAVPHTADDSAAARAGRSAPAAPIITDAPPAARAHSPSLAPAEAQPPLGAPGELGHVHPHPPSQHQHGALVGLAEGLERAVLQPLEGARDAVAVAHEEMAAERVGDPFRRSLVPAYDDAAGVGSEGGRLERGNN